MFRHQHEEVDSFKTLECVSKKAKSIDVPETFLHRNLNEGHSGGEKKWNKILQMVALDPEVAVLDEAGSGLDIGASQAFSKGINTLANEEKAVVLTTHDVVNEMAIL